MADKCRLDLHIHISRQFDKCWLVKSRRTLSKSLKFKHSMNLKQAIWSEFDKFQISNSALDVQFANQKLIAERETQKSRRNPMIEFHMMFESSRQTDFMLLAKTIYI